MNDFWNAGTPTFAMLSHIQSIYSINQWISLCGVWPLTFSFSFYFAFVSGGIFPLKKRLFCGIVIVKKILYNTVKNLEILYYFFISKT